MDFDIIAIDFDGTLNNPVIAFAAVVVGLIFGVALVNLVLGAVRRTWPRVIVALLVLMLIAFYSRQQTRWLAGILYGFLGAGWNVGFIFGTPKWFSPATGFAAATAFLMVRMLLARLRARTV